MDKKQRCNGYKQKLCLVSIKGGFAMTWFPIATPGGTHKFIEQEGGVGPDDDDGDKDKDGDSNAAVLVA